MYYNLHTNKGAAKMILSSPGMEDRLDELTDRTDALLPTLQKGYSIHLHRVYCPSICGSNRGSDVLHPKRAVDLEGMSPSKAIIKPSLTSFGTNHIDSSNHTSHHLEQVSGPNQQKYRGLFVPLLVVFVLLPGILLSSSNTVGKVSLDKRVELNNHCQYNAINAVQSGEENLDSIGVPPTGAAVMLGETRGSPVERGLEGWRDWIDVKLGWRGHAT